MPSPFPGMNPYLENSELWSDFHHRLITAIADLLAPQLEPKYIVAIERRIYEVIGENPLLVGIPDVMVQRPLNATNSTTNVAILSPPAQPITVTVPIPETIRQSYLEVRQVGTNQVVTSIEILSPVNKRSGKGREIYEAKRQNVLGSFTNLVYDRAVYRLQINYNSEPVPALAEAEATWADALLKEQALRAT